MITDITGIILTPSDNGKNCDGDGICCDECDYLLCCTTTENDCDLCTDTHCPNRTAKKVQDDTHL